jgi:hypothetical protein
MSSPASIPDLFISFTPKGKGPIAGLEKARCAGRIGGRAAGNSYVPRPETKSCLSMNSLA